MSKEAEAFKELCEITALLNKNAQRNAVTSQKYPSVTSPRNAVTVPEDKLLELQRKAKLVDELKEINKDLLRQIDSQEKLIAKLIESGDKEE